RTPAPLARVPREDRGGERRERAGRARIRASTDQPRADAKSHAALHACTRAQRGGAERERRAPAARWHARRRLLNETARAERDATPALRWGGPGGHPKTNGESASSAVRSRPEPAC